VRASSLYRTEPVGDSSQPWYINAVAELHTTWGVGSLFRRLRLLERAAGRPAIRASGGSRTLDLDLLLFDDLILWTRELVLPHPRLHERRFVLEPLAEIAPDALDPRTGLSVAELLAELTDPDRVERLPAVARRQPVGFRVP
jgi:2-amino-4-hydroxy-6-hydroxymethyldihydropteridine diphosphokinase